MEALDVVKARTEAEAKEITQMDKASIKSKDKMEVEGIEIIRAGSEARKISKLN